SASDAANARLVREARAAAAFDHPNAVAIFDVGEVDGAPYIVMDLDELRSALEAAERGDAVVSTTMAQQFSTSEVREVLGRAIERQSAKQDSIKLGFDDLIAVAAEVGVDVGSLREASRELRVRGEE